MIKAILLNQKRIDKSILVIDTPKRCDDCPLLFEGHCGRTLMELELDYNETYDYIRPSWCPLRNLPERKFSLVVVDSDGARFEEPTEFEQGYNSCIDEILRDE